MKFDFYPSLKFKLSACILVIFALLAIFAPFIAHHEPIACQTEQGWKLTIFDQKSINTRPTDCFLPLIPYGPQKTNINEFVSISPLESQEKLGFRFRHWLGTDKLGRDVASGMIHGTKVALQIGFLSVFIAFIIGVTIGMISAYYKDEHLKLNSFQLIILFISIFLLVYYNAYEWYFNGVNYVYIGFTLAIQTIVFKLVMLIESEKMKRFSIPLDTILVKIIEIRKSFPGIFILLALTSIFVTPSVWNIILIIALLSWPEFARYARAETLAIKEETYITSVRVLGFGHFKIIFRHILPNILPTLVVISCFNVSGAILLESTLSFLGIGLPVEQVTWGKMMAEGRSMMYWWMVIFPGLALFTIIFSLNNIADTLTESMTAKNKKTS